MKTENFNLNVNALDDKALYEEICKKIKETDAISFKLLGLVPSVSGGGIIILWTEAENLRDMMLVMTGLFGALITYFIYRWEKRNIQTCNTFKLCAEMIEIRKQLLEQSEENVKSVIEGPYRLLRSQGKPKLLGESLSVRGWGKTEAETAIYSVTILFWLVLALMIFI
jgi:hypothetical protein